MSRSTWRSPDVGVGEDRRDRQHDQHRVGRREADPEPDHEDDQQRVGRDRPAEVGDAHGHERALPGVADRETGRDGDDDGGDDRHRREHDVFQRAVRDARRAAPVARVREPGDDLADQVHDRALTFADRRVQGVAIRPMVDHDQVQGDREEHGHDRADVDRGRVPEVEPAQHQLPEAALPDDRGDHHEPDRGDRRDPQSGDDQRHRQGQVHPEQAAPPRVAHAIGGLGDVARHRIEARRRCSG